MERSNPCFLVELIWQAPDTDQRTAYAIRRVRQSNGQEFPEQLAELRAYFNPALASEIMYVKAIPGNGLNIPIWLLGSSVFSAQLGGMLGLPFAFASHFSPEGTLSDLEI